MEMEMEMEMKMDRCWSTLPDELMREILGKLPVKSLMRFKCINKSWRDLIGSSDFANFHFDRNKNKPFSHLRECLTTIHLFTNNNNKHTTTTTTTTTTTKLNLPFINKSNAFGFLKGSIVGSSANGLVCIRLWQESYLTFVIWNPATREFRYLPKPQSPKTQLMSSNCAGFDLRPYGVCDYKLVVIMFYMGERKLQLQVEALLYTRSTNSWKKIEDGVVPHMGVCAFDGVSLNGSIYWPALEISSIEETSPSQFVACFDMWEEKFTRITGPCCADAYRYTKRLGVVGGSSLAMFFVGDLADCLDGWIMNGEDRSWAKLFSISPILPSLALNETRVVGLLLNGEIVIDTLSIHRYLYDLSTKQLKNIQEGYYLFQYKEALFSV